MARWAEGAQLLKDYLDARGMSAGAVAKGQPFTPQAVSSWTRGEYRPSKVNARIVDDLLEAGGALQAAWGWDVVILPARQALEDRVAVLEAALTEDRSEIAVLKQHVRDLTEGLATLRSSIEPR